MLEKNVDKFRMQHYLMSLLGRKTTAIAVVDEGIVRLGVCGRSGESGVCTEPGSADSNGIVVSCKAVVVEVVGNGSTGGS